MGEQRKSPSYYFIDLGLTKKTVRINEREPVMKLWGVSKRLFDEYLEAHTIVPQLALEF